MRQLVGELRTALGAVTIDPMTSAAIQRAAELGVIAADLRARRIRGEAVDIAELVKAENMVRRAIADLGIKPVARRERAGQALAEYLATLPEAEPHQASEDDEAGAGDAPPSAAGPSGDEGAE